MHKQGDENSLNEDKAAPSQSAKDYLSRNNRRNDNLAEK